MFESNSVSKTIGGAIDQESNELPNIVIFLTDQERTTDLWMPQGFATSHEQLPAQNYLKDNGLSFSNAFTNTNMCSSARATFFTGKFPAQHEVSNLLADTNNPVINDQIQLNPDLPNLATYLQEAGYDADNIFYKGKWHLSKSVVRTMGTADSSDDEEVYVDMTDYGFQQWEGPDAGGTAAHPLGGPITTPTEENPSQYPEGYDAGYTDQAVRLINSRSKQDKPFALVLSLVNPHDLLAYPVPLSIRQDGENTNALFSKYFGYDWKDLIGPSGMLPSMNENLTPNNPDGTIPDDYTLKPHLQIENLNGIDSFFPPPTTKLEKLSYINFYLNLIARADQQQYKVIEALEINNLIKDTLIIKTSDHGEMGLAHGGTRQKANVAYQEAVDVPLIWSYPGKIKQGSTSALASHVDFLPTLGGLLGIPTETTEKYQFSGIDYSKVLTGEVEHSQEYTLFTFDDVYTAGDPSDVYPTKSMQPVEDYWPYTGKAQNPAFGIFDDPNRIHMIQNEDFKLVRYYSSKDPTNQQLWQEEFYDKRPSGGDYYQPEESDKGRAYLGTNSQTGKEIFIHEDYLTQGERVFGLPIPNQLSKAPEYDTSFAPAPLEMVNLSPWAEQIRVKQGKEKIATEYQLENYNKMNQLLNDAIADRLQPLTPTPAVAPEIITDNDGNRIFSLKPSAASKGLTQELEIAFTTRSSQTYAIQYLGLDPQVNPSEKVWITAASGIQGTNGPVYQYIKGIPNDIDIKEVRVQWALTDTLVPLAPIPAVAPEIISDNNGDLIFSLKPSIADKGLTQELVIAFTTQSTQTYAIQYLDEDPSLEPSLANPQKQVWVTAASGIQGTNNVVYQNIKGIPIDIDIEDIRIQWIGSSLSPTRTPSPSPTPIPSPIPSPTSPTPTPTPDADGVVTYTDADDSLTDQNNVKVRMMGGNDYVEITGGINNFANGNMGDDRFVLRSGEAGQYLGGKGSDTFEVFGGIDNYVNGNIGGDSITLNGGQGRYLGGDDSDKIDVLNAEDGTSVNGNRGQDFITGNAGGVTYRGGAGDDVIQASQGDIYGDRGADIFKGQSGDGYAVIQDYTIGEDVVELAMDGIWSKIESGLIFTDNLGEQIMLLVGINDVDQVKTT